MLRRLRVEFLLAMTSMFALVKNLLSSCGFSWGRASVEGGIKMFLVFCATGSTRYLKKDREASVVLKGLVF